MENKVKNSSFWQTFRDVPAAVFHFHELLDISGITWNKTCILHNKYIYILYMIYMIYVYIYIYVKLKYTYIPNSAICPYLLLLESLQFCPSLLANKPPAYRLGIPNQAVAACNPMTLEIIHRPRCEFHRFPYGGFLGNGSGTVDASWYPPWN